MNTLEDFAIGDRVNVDPWQGDLFDNFNGRIIGRRGKFFIVEDQDEDAWECDPDQLSATPDDSNTTQI